MIAFLSLLRALEFIEEKIHDPFSIEDVANAAYLSVSQLNRTFAHVFHSSPANYILKRRLCVAAKELAETEQSILDIALGAQFGAAESFSRAFKRQFLVSPSQYRREGKRFHELYPPYALPNREERGTHMTTQKQYNRDILHEKILASKGTYILMADMDHLMEMNETKGRAAGDAALAAIFSRIDEAIEEGMVFFRTGNDDFTILTGSDDLALCEKVARSILSHADEDVPYPDGTVKVSVSVGIGFIPLDIADPQTAIDYADQAMVAAKHAGRNTYRIYENA